MTETPTFLTQVRAGLERHVRAGERVCMGLSGGLDSMALLHALQRLAPTLGFSLAACHIHHGLSANADAWSEFCATECAAWGIPLSVARVAVLRRSGLGLEAAARNARHEVFAALAADWVVLAHHRGDQAETVLHRLLRGGGARGLSGMAEVRAARARLKDAPLPEQQPGPSILRPLLDTPRAQILAWAQAEGLRWIEDESNADSRFTRNFLRRDILPRVAERFPEAEATLARAARQFGEVDSMLVALADLDLAAARVTSPWGEAWRVATLAGFGTPRAVNALRCAVERHGADAGRAELEEVWRQLAGAGPEANIHAVLRAAEVRGWRGLAWVSTRVESAPPEPMPWPQVQGHPSAEVPWCGGVVRLEHDLTGGLKHEALSHAGAQLRTRQAGDHIRLRAAGTTRSLKNLFQEHGVPPWLRPQLPLLAVGGEVLWLAGVGANPAWSALPGQSGFALVWVPARPRRGGLLA